MPDPNNLILPDLGIAWFGICKNANTSIKCALLDAVGINLSPVTVHQHHDLGDTEYADKYTIMQSDIWSFAIVRDPFTRLESCWKNKCFKGWKQAGGDYGLKPRMPFEDFVRAICDTKDPNCTGFGQHWRSQYVDITFSGHIIPNFIGRYEKLVYSWRVIQNAVLVFKDKYIADLQVSNKTPVQVIFWTEEMRNLVKQRYAEDFELFYEHLL